MGGVDGVDGVDGRVARGERNRQALVTASLELTAEKGEFPTAREIAARAKLASRSVFHHFQDLDALFAEAAATQSARHWSLLKPVDPDLPVMERVGVVVDQRAALYERISPVRRVACRHENEWPSLADRLQQSRAALRRHLRRAFAPELADADRAVVAAVEAAGAWETWEVLRFHQRMPVSIAKEALASLIVAPIREGISPWAATSSS